MRLIFLLALLFLAPPVHACTGMEECALGDRAYHVREPDGWDGTTPLPVMLHFHGWGRQGETIMGHARIAGATVPRGVLLVAPDGLGRSWDFRQPGSRDTPFAEAVLADVGARYPLDGRVIVSGYSWGALMAARFTCETQVPIAALLLVSGAFPRGMACDGQPGRVSQVYGTTDTVLDFPYGPDGDETEAVALWRRQLDCGPPSRTFEWEAVSWLTHTRHQWDCAAGLVTMDVHPASHLIPRGWFARILDEVLAPA
ncbi:PHB depolymerase family esterase [Jannaschia sp. 2305UL9-9]|uniref:alpha/beta hydrolase family esterase n=1 Tax=Jannaschia sp. 2305UL9-9 TaxID=3121638 RepID=UPI003527BF62